MQDIPHAIDIYKRFTRVNASKSVRKQMDSQPPEAEVQLEKKFMARNLHSYHYRGIFGSLFLGKADGIESESLQ